MVAIPAGFQRDLGHVPVWDWPSVGPLAGGGVVAPHNSPDGLRPCFWTWISVPLHGHPPLLGPFWIPAGQFSGLLYGLLVPFSVDDESGSSAHPFLARDVLLVPSIGHPFWETK